MNRHLFEIPERVAVGEFRGAGACVSKTPSRDVLTSQAVTGCHGNRINDMNARKDGVEFLEKRLSGNASGIRSFAGKLFVGTAVHVAGIIDRVIELAVSLIVISVLVCPLMLVLMIRKLVNGNPVFTSQIITGAGSRPVEIYRFNGIGVPFRDLPLFFGVLSGRLALAGVAIRNWGEREPSLEGAYIGMMKPGVISLWDLRRSSKTAHEGRQAIEWEYTFRKGLVYDLLLMLRAIPMLVFGESKSEASEIFRIMGLDLDNLTMDEAISVIGSHLDAKKQRRIFFVNPDCLNKTVTDREYFEILQSGDFVFPDGIGLIIAGKMLNTPLKENINGTDMLPFLCRMAAARGEKVFLLGGKPGVAEIAAQKISENYGVTVAGTSHGYFDHRSESAAVIEQINASGASILLVAFGAPLQERWIHQHRDALRPLIMMGVGGLLDFYSGNIRRAPRWVREIGFEWVYRIMQEPGRMWRRYVIGNPLFLYRVLKWKILYQR